jgi:hypothetical protein
MNEWKKDIGTLKCGHEIRLIVCNDPKDLESLHKKEANLNIRYVIRLIVAEMRPDGFTETAFMRPVILLKEHYQEPIAVDTVLGMFRMAKNNMSRDIPEPWRPMLRDVDIEEIVTENFPDVLKPPIA